MIRRIAAIASVGIMLSGCSSSLRVSEIKNDLPPGSAVDGIPFRLPKQSTLKVYELTDMGYRPVYSQPVTIADPDRLFVLGFESLPLANSTVDFKMNADNTLQQVGLKSDSHGAAALTELGTQAAAVNTAVNAAESARRTGATGDAGLAIAADKARQSADLAQLQYDNLAKDGNASPIDLMKAANLARSAKLDANEAARAAGRSPYYPDVIP